MIQAIKTSAFTRKIYLILVVGAIVSAVLLIIVASRAQVSLQLQRTATVESNGMQLRVEADKEQYAIGEPVRVRFFQKNLRNGPAMLGIGKIEVIVRNSNGQPALGVIIDSTGDPALKIAPMEEIEVVSPFLWDQTDINFKQVPAGTYTISMILDGTPLELRIAVGN